MCYNGGYLKFFKGIKMIKKVRKVGHYCPQIENITVSIPYKDVFINPSTCDEKYIPWKQSVFYVPLEGYEYQHTQYSHVDTVTDRYVFKGKTPKINNVYFKNCKKLEFEYVRLKKQLLKMFNISTIIITTAERDIFSEMESFAPSNIVAPIGPYLHGCLGETKVIVNPFIDWNSPTITLSEKMYSNLITRGRNHLVIGPATNKWQLKHAIDLQELLK